VESRYNARISLRSESTIGPSTLGAPEDVVSQTESFKRTGVEQGLRVHVTVSAT
jgi:hypothetical protein